jgi:hypothetical protein
MNRHAKDNLLFALHRYAERQDENFVTEAFGHLLRFLLVSARPYAMAILRMITGDAFFGGVGEDELVDVDTQFSHEAGRSDILIVTAMRIAIIENKVESAVDVDQLDRYWGCPLG